MTHSPRAYTSLTMALLALSTGCSTTQGTRTPGTNVGVHVLVEASFEPAWMERDAWTLTLLSDGSVVAHGRSLGHFRKRISQDALSKIAQTAMALTETLDSASYTSIVEDADAIRLRVKHGDQVFEYRVEQPQSINCTSSLGTLAHLWDLVILGCAPRASCNGSTCLLCDAQEGASKPSATTTRPAPATGPAATASPCASPASRSMTPRPTPPPGLEATTT